MELSIGNKYITRKKSNRSLIISLMIISYETIIRSQVVEKLMNETKQKKVS